MTISSAFESLMHSDSMLAAETGVAIDHFFLVGHWTSGRLCSKNLPPCPSERRNRRCSRRRGSQYYVITKTAFPHHKPCPSLCLFPFAHHLSLTPLTRRRHLYSDLLNSRLRAIVERLDRQISVSLAALLPSLSLVAPGHQCNL